MLFAVYFAIYTGILIISTQFMDKPKYLIDKIREMKAKGISQYEIAKEFDISESKVSRMLSKTKTPNT